MVNHTLVPRVDGKILAVHFSITNEKFGAKFGVTSITRKTFHFDSKRQAISTSISCSQMRQVLCVSAQTANTQAQFCKPKFMSM